MKSGATGWVLYDFANSAYHLLIITVLFPLVFREALYVDRGGADAMWGVIVAVPVLIAGVAAPFAGSYMDSMGWKRAAFVWSVVATIILAFLLAIIPLSCGALAIAVFAAGLFMFSISQFAYNTLMPGQATDRRFAQLSGLGWGIGYLGGILCMLLVMPVIDDKILPGDYGAYRTAFAIVAAYYLLFSLPALLCARDNGSTVSQGLSRRPFSSAWHTLLQWRKHRNLFRFLAGFYLVNDGLATLVFFTSLFAATTLGMSTPQIMVAFFIVQLVGIPATILSGWGAERWGYMRVLLVSIVVWIGNGIGFLLVSDAMDLYLLSVPVGFVIGTTPALARAVLARLASQENTAEVYGFHALTGRVSSILGPLAFGAIATATGSQRLALCSILVFFVLGFVVLVGVRDEGIEPMNGQGRQSA